MSAPDFVLTSRARAAHELRCKFFGQVCTLVSSEPSLKIKESEKKQAKNDWISRRRPLKHLPLPYVAHCFTRVLRLLNLCCVPKGLGRKDKSGMCSGSSWPFLEPLNVPK
ncbi:unnamed protein product [Ixodes pacificus]